MKILESQSATLSNKEVLAHLISLRSKPHSSPPKIQNLETVVKALTEYLSAPPASSPSSGATSSEGQTNENAIKSLVTRLQMYNLTKAELVMLINLMPEELGLLDCIIEECDLRFSEEEQVGILGIVRDVLIKRG